MFLDESGDLGRKGSEYFVIATLVVDSPKRLDRIIKNMRRNKFKKELKKANEIKANSSSEALRRYMIQQLNSLENVRVYGVVFEKQLNHNSLLQKDMNKLYNYVAGALAKQITLKDNLVIKGETGFKTKI